ncbi:bifunctional UDP-N-acetylglucosamine diphosphorylase/glucosamine-1-phosphate N-acetyltransferase GlmU [Candidatus Thioglobus sp.]|jgi:bifunctional UDP-N-acetylglucosamine pyrophosphorylase/glucosamine-1-phosphate N-acetyltransferase|uniref:bifunctional UDP-N-acetylglucosamine diphosphorylase/glucosamine-1-phosphate N-acetyltransferase GlmU n=1 Tax=Candidatus Thioglobus sp. TaxID=2026721 RepID=UPI001D72BB40|nr:bifunctional UDP-N-acetylglucosamine diphosphorylase/glucosamine-1-phosphate N-acetyltransferase GlmU [Candidatus Thioglobus sp.]MBT3276881.1 bifunctional UDP-N-acetylglucosamine diphosphorylase/glucosamine-1-phosphate N-acetyltransferase GlmU [Candidatus Thioglobus sp.]MBT3446363.1 bifunctional UDP-N-acetylglucosamine diphosphorylase/glucosamine-1-phosphate N-acetyltransferase GlmU [Candidatus Thioglobus sp.]MBT6022887.1 bifunctional UDP-N-acetylglucosamine diphosphorylase/glucosamine-1-phos
MTNIHAIILAAGKGTRMNSSKPKVLQILADNTLLGHVLKQAKLVSQQIHVVYGFGGNQVKQTINDDSINWVEQVEQLGTGHAVQQATPHIEEDSVSLILYGDVPLIQQTTLEQLIDASKTSGIALLSVVLEDPTGYGRIIRNNETIQAIVEQKDANVEQLKVCEVNTGIMAVQTALLKKYLSGLDANNAQGELYLTDIIESAVNDGKTVASVITIDESEVAGVNDKVQLAELERIYQQQKSDQYMQQGLSLKDPSRFDCRGDLSFGQDCEIDFNTLIEGVVTLGNNTTIAPNCCIKNSKIGDHVTILANSVIEDAVIGNGASIGPFARVRPQADIGENAKVGNFVEVKKSIIGKGSKISHLSYVGDATVGADVNIGAGVITCNYDGVNKHQTIIGDGAFIGSDSQLVAPVTIGKNATIGAGSTITASAPEDQLTLSRSKQRVFPSWNRPVKK